MCCIAGAVECAARRTGFRIPWSDMITKIYCGPISEYIAELATFAGEARLDKAWVTGG